jgi:DNA modification methylase
MRVDEYLAQRLLLGDCRDALGGIPEASIDACVTDPPYHLTARAGGARGFMGHAWDGGRVASDPATWASVWRVLKPGAHLLAWGGPRTYHRMACAVEDAGFEIRDCIGQLYASGYPASLNISAAIDNSSGLAPGELAGWLRSRRESLGMTHEDVAAALGVSAEMVRQWESGRRRYKGREVEHIVPGPAHRARLGELFGYPPSERQCAPGSAPRRRDGTVYGLGHSGAPYAGPSTGLARAWVGWGTALKPAWEMILVARKPLAGTVADNVLSYGTGGLNIDACRVRAMGRPLIVGGSSPTPGKSAYGGGRGGPGGGSRNAGSTNTGRWPPNVVFVHAPGCTRVGTRIVRTGTAVRHNGASAGRIALAPAKPPGTPDHGYADEAGMEETDDWLCEPGCPVGELNRQSSDDPYDMGAASRYFPAFAYGSKAGAAERPVGPGQLQHPTVKPLWLARWLLRLVLPPGGTVLDPFLGSGTTAEAAIVEGFDWVGCEICDGTDGRPDYVSLVRQRVERALAGHTPGTEEGDAWAASEAQREALRQAGQGSLF